MCVVVESLMELCIRFEAQLMEKEKSYEPSHPYKSPFFSLSRKVHFCRNDEQIVYAALIIFRKKNPSPSLSGRLCDDFKVFDMGV